MIDGVYPLLVKEPRYPHESRNCPVLSRFLPTQWRSWVFQDLYGDTIEGLEFVMMMAAEPTDEHVRALPSLTFHRLFTAFLRTFTAFSLPLGPSTFHRPFTAFLRTFTAFPLPLGPHELQAPAQGALAAAVRLERPGRAAGAPPGQLWVSERSSAFAVFHWPSSAFKNGAFPLSFLGRVIPKGTAKMLVSIERNAENMVEVAAAYMQQVRRETPPHFFTAFRGSTFQSRNVVSPCAPPFPSGFSVLKQERFSRSAPGSSRSLRGSRKSYRTRRCTC